MILLIEGFYHADTADIFLNDIVERVVGAKNAAKQRPDLANNQKQQQCHNGNNRKENKCNGRVNAERHNHGKYQHDRAAHCHANQHLIGILNIGHVGCQAGDDGSSGELVNVGKGKGLYVVIHILSQICRKPYGGFCRNVGGKHACQ